MLYATILTRDTERSNPTDDTSITFANRGPMQPETIVSWFYPGDKSGHEFIYSKQEERELAQVKHHTVVPLRGLRSKSRARRLETRPVISDPTKDLAGDGIYPSPVRHLRNTLPHLRISVCRRIAHTFTG